MNALPSILDKIIKTKQREICQREQETPLQMLKEKLGAIGAPRGFFNNLRNKVASGQAAVIAEIKKASPSQGIIRHDFDPEAIARMYEKAGAACLSVLTDHDYFQGSEIYLEKARAASRLPILRKDFIVDPYQVYEARAIGADCILLIVAVLDERALSALYDLAKDLGMDVLIEVHDEEELKSALRVEPSIIGINNRNLKTFKTSLDITLGMLSLIPDGCQVVTESGIHERKDVERMQLHGINSFLVGEAFMREPDPGEALRDLFFK